jgi:hypothetical protein
MIRIFSTPQPIEASNITIAEEPIKIKTLAVGILQPGIVQ